MPYITVPVITVHAKEVCFRAVLFVFLVRVFVHVDTRTVAYV